MLHASPVWTPLKFDEDGCKEIYSKYISTFKNAYSFFEMYANADNIDPREYNIPVKDRENVFDAFFTTSNPVNTNQSKQDLSGSGLGLKIVRDIVESYGGTIMVIPPKEGYATTIKLTIPKVG